MRKIHVVAVALVALLLSAGGATAASKLITSKQIKNGTIGTADLSASAKRALKGNEGPAGPAGAKGATGASGSAGSVGPAGPSAAAGTIRVAGPIVTMTSPSVDVYGSVQPSKADCPAGYGVISGGFDGGVRTFISANYPSGNGWFVIGVNTGASSEQIQAFAVCAPGGAAPAARSSVTTEHREDAALAGVRAVQTKEG